MLTCPLPTDTRSARDDANPAFGVDDLPLLLASFIPLLNTAGVLPIWAIWRIPMGSAFRCKLCLAQWMRIALFQPDIPQNTGTILRLSACMGVAVDVIGPTGFDMSDRALRRAGLDYLEHVVITRHTDWPAFLAARGDSRLVLLTSHGATPYTDLKYLASDTLLLGRESAGAPVFVHEAASERVRIPMQAGMRSLNIAVATAMVLGEALRQVAASA